MSAPEISILPPQLNFPIELNQQTRQYLELTNPHERDVCFKVKTTAPRRYCVRPNAARITAGQSVKVEVLLQSMAQYPSGAECRDKFLVQAAWMPPSQPGSDEAQLISELWSKHAATEKDRKTAGGAGAKQYQEKKLKAHIILPGDSPPPLATTSASTTVATTPPSATAPTGAASSKEVADLQATVAELQAKLAAKDGAGGAPRLELMYAVMFALLAFVLGYFL